MAPSPLLMIPRAQHHHEHLHNLTFFSLKYKRPYSLINSDYEVDFSESLHQDFFVGSSNGWLAFKQQNSHIPFLLNPFSKTKIYLPSIHTLPSEPAPGSKIEKLVLCGDPSDDNNYTVIAMHSAGLRTNISFCRRGDEKWTDLGSKIMTCYDIVCCDLTKLAFALGPGPKVEEWDLSRDVPSLKTVVQGSFPNTLARSDEIYPRDLYTSKWYLALSGFSQMFLVVRNIGEFVRHDGAVVHEEDTLTDYASEPLVCPYKTVGFHVFRYDYFGDRKKWVEVETLDDCALFLGGNESTMVKTTTDGEVKGNAIYFTDDYWDSMVQDYSYGGHDMGIFNMEDGSIVPVLETEEPRIVPPPVWINFPLMSDYEFCFFE